MTQDTPEVAAARAALAKPWWHPDCGYVVDVVYLAAALAALDEAREHAALAFSVMRVERDGPSTTR